jgi:hypothetical protein
LLAWSLCLNRQWLLNLPLLGELGLLLLLDRNLLLIGKLGLLLLLH